MSIHVSDPIPLRSGPRDSVRVVTSPIEGRVSLVFQVGKQPGFAINIDLTTEAARELRRVLPKPVAK